MRIRERAQQFYDDHRIWWFVIFTVMLLASVFVWRIPAAVSAEPRMGNCRISDSGCWTPKQATNHFRGGYYKHADGMKVGRIYDHPAKARVAWLHNIQKWADNHPAQWNHVKANLPSSGRHFSDGGGSPWTCPPDAGNMVCEIYLKIQWKATCVSMAPDPTNAPEICSVFEQPYIDWKTVQTAGKVVGCGGVIAIGIAAARTGTSGLVAGWGGAFCTFGLWTDFMVSHQ